ncbi:formimidoylglutamase [Kosakonia pseudosacchari]|uniref:formimidoylglutamase n=1 Tax=Kosakonia pseudosacchari TaxID=1646340 RepID=UPI00187FF960|nr:formimidoylglutamase [Kosakonia pseudosacchari]QOV62743.1 formimidoylglutamase [Kosakonia pseudosacchari]
MTLWHPVEPTVWQGRDDSAEAANALRVFQTIASPGDFSPQQHRGKVALLGFECDEGVKRNQGRAGAAQGPDVLRKALAGMASQPGHGQLVEMGNIRALPDKLEEAQQALHDALLACQRSRMRTLVFGGGHETAFAHGCAILDAFPNERIGIINLDAHLDLRHAQRASSGTPFRQLALHCEAQQRGFHYSCIGASVAANTQALWDEAANRNVTVIDDLAVLHAYDDRVMPEIARNIASYDRLYLTIDLDVLPAWEMPAVSAPAALGIPLALLLRIVEPLCRSGKLQAVDLVEYNPLFDLQGAGAKVAARLAWQILHWWRG